ncbi:hypothetical protein M434DRAFT_322422 [Hypoxylon sp. CO27-5]|nr:hypothetical protein M434DRAFT_322422 [Hypoxylon sp. CO27-5]
MMSSLHKRLGRHTHFTTCMADFSSHSVVVYFFLPIRPLFSPFYLHVIKIKIKRKGMREC